MLSPFQLPLLYQVHKKLGVCKARVADPSWLKGNSLSCDTTLWINGSWLGDKYHCMNKQAIGVTNSQQVHFALLAFYIIIISSSSILSFFVLLSCSYLSLWVFFPFWFSLQCPVVLGSMSEWLCGPRCRLGLNHNTQLVHENKKWILFSFTSILFSQPHLKATPSEVHPRFNLTFSFISISRKLRW